MIIDNIIDINSRQTRTDDLYPQRIGCRVKFLFPPHPNTCMFLSYMTDNCGNAKSGCIRTSPVKQFVETRDCFVIDTVNSRYILLKEPGDNDVFDFL